MLRRSLVKLILPFFFASNVIAESNLNTLEQPKLQISVFDNYVEIKRPNGSSQKLLLNDTPNIDKAPTQASPFSGATKEMRVKRSDLELANSNLPQTLSEARGVPFFASGKVTGMRLFAIKKGSIWTKLGFINGDVVMGADGNKFSDLSQIAQLLEAPTGSKKTFQVQRNSQPLQISIEIE